MKGLTFNLLERVVVDELGEDIWAQIVAGAGGRETYEPDGEYSHEELIALVRETAIAVSRSADDTLRWFGSKSVSLLAELFPQAFTPHTTTMEFVVTLNEIIHPGVDRRIPGAISPEFAFERVTDDTLIVSYQSYRDMCPFAEGLLLGAAAHYGEEATVEHFHCQRYGSPRCAMLLRVYHPID